MPGHVRVVDQFIDRTFAARETFFGTASWRTCRWRDPVCPLLAGGGEGRRAEGIAATRGGTYLVHGGAAVLHPGREPSSTAPGAVDVIGMTNMPEAKLAREAELRYATVALATDYDCWHDDHAHVDVADVIQVMHANVAKAHRLISGWRALPARRRPAHRLDRALERGASSPRPSPRPARAGEARRGGGAGAELIGVTAPGPRHIRIVAYARACANSAKLATIKSA